MHPQFFSPRRAPSIRKAGILWDYLSKIALPRPRAFRPDFRRLPGLRPPPWHSVATGRPPLCRLVRRASVAPLAWRRRLPFVVCAPLVLRRHLLESTICRSDLYFEHRN